MLVASIESREIRSVDHNSSPVVEDSDVMVINNEMAISTRHSPVGRCNPVASIIRHKVNDSQ
jgi:hypothetical protein